MSESGSEVFVKSIYENTKRPPKIKLYGTPMCCRCKTAKAMLEHRSLSYEFIMVESGDTHDIPYIDIDGKIYEGKNALMAIRSIGKNE